MKDAPTITINLGSPLFLIFLILKLTNVIDWSWWWVTAPLWLPFAIFFGALALMAIVAFIVAALT